MVVSHFKKLALTQRRQQVAELYLKGHSQSAIGEQLGVAQSTVWNDLDAIRRQWRESAVRDFDETRAVELQKLDLLEREAWDAWKRSQKPQQSAVFVGDSAGPESRKTLSNRDGDPRFLEIIHKCIAQRRALLGLDILAPETKHDDDLTPDLRRTRVLTVLSELRQSVAVAELATGLGDLQSRLPGPGDEPGEMVASPPSDPSGPGPGGSPG